MSATMALVRIQLHFLKWPLVVLTGCVIALLLPFSALKDTLSVASALFVLIGAVVSGALIFGEEYAEGSRDYLATRPVASMHAFSVKVLMLLIYSIPAAIIVDDGFSFFHPYWRTIEYERMVPLVWGLLFGLSLWCAGTAILTKDTVRGMLYGPPTYFLVCVLVWLLPSPFYRNLASVKTIVGSEEGVLNLSPQYQFIDDLFVVGLVSLSPLLILGLVICIYRSMTFQQITITKTAFVLFLLYMTAYGIAWKTVSVDTVPEAQMIEERIFAIDRTHERIYTVRDPVRLSDAETPSTTRTVVVRDLLDPTREIRSFERPCLYQYCGYSIQDFIHEDNYYVEIGRQEKGPSFLDVHPINDQGDLESPLRIENQGLLQEIRFYDANRIIARDCILNESGQVDWREENLARSSTKIIDLNSGVVKELWHGWKFGSSQISWGQLFYKTDLIYGTVQKPRLETLVSRMTQDLTIEKTCTLPPIGIQHAVDKDLFVFVPSGFDKEDAWSVGESRVELCDVRDPNSPKTLSLSFPSHFYTIPNYTYKVLSLLGNRVKSESLWSSINHVNLEMGSGIVCVQYYNRVAMWDVLNPDEPLFLGVVPFAPGSLGSVVRQGQDQWKTPLSIIRYPDGKLGFPVGKSIYRYEFPALMKEAKS